MERTTDKLVRPDLREYLNLYYDSGSIYEEIAIDRHKVIVDMAVFTEGEAIGFEIKSGKDNLRRLPHQIISYDKFFSRNYIVVDDNHLSKVEAMVPHHWGILLAYHDGLDIVIELYRDAGPNPNQNKRTVLELLWRDETTYLLKKHGIYKGLSKARMTKRRSVLAAQLSIDEVIREIYHLLPQRDGWKTND